MLRRVNPATDQPPSSTKYTTRASRRRGPNATVVGFSQGDAGESVAGNGAFKVV
jgi:hypothetical protein